MISRVSFAQRRFLSDILKSKKDWVGCWRYGSAQFRIEANRDQLFYRERFPDNTVKIGVLHECMGEDCQGWMASEFEHGSVRVKLENGKMLSKYCIDGLCMPEMAAVRTVEAACIIDADEATREKYSTPGVDKTAKEPMTWENPTQNHIWEKQEIDGLLNQMRTKPPHYAPQTKSDSIMKGMVIGLYNVFNKVSMFDKKNPTVRSCTWRLLILESIAGVPGMVAASLRHLKSLRTLKRDHGWIHTLLEEAENERMHLLICLKMFNPSLLTRFFVVAGQYTMTTVLVAMYLVHPQSVHRFVGYLEECACVTYTELLTAMATEGTHLNKHWSQLPAPEIAKVYYHLKHDALWKDVLRCIFADESHHRDVNHAFAGMQADAPNPFVARHRQDKLRAFDYEASERISELEKRAAKL